MKEDCKVDLEQTLERIINNKDFNVEEKMFLNRLAFLLFKKNAHRSTFNNFSKKVTTLQVT